MALYDDFEGAKNIHVLQVLFGALEDDGGSWLGFGILILIWIWSLVFDTPMIQIWALSLDFKMQRTFMSFKSSYGALEDQGSSWLGFGILILMWLLVFDTPMIQILAVNLNFEGHKHTAWVKHGTILNLCMKHSFLEAELNWLDPLGVVINNRQRWLKRLWISDQWVPFGSLSWFWRSKEHPCPLSPHLRLFRIWKVHDWGLTPWSWFGYGH